MALDFCIRNNHSEPIMIVSLGLNAFYDIVEFSKSNSDFSFIAEKLKDYYEDAEFYISELPLFKTQLEGLSEKFTNNKETLETLYLLINLSEAALNLNKAIDVISD